MCACILRKIKVVCVIVYKTGIKQHVLIYNMFRNELLKIGICG